MTETRRYAARALADELEALDMEQNPPWERMRWTPAFKDHVIENIERHTNGRLIAAAPDLLEALKSADEWMSCVEPHLRDGKPFKLDRERIRIAIAKATGEA